MNNELKVSFYLKREGNTERTETNPDTVFPIVGKIIIGNTIAQFGSKLKIEERLWSVKSGRAIGKSRVAVELNREINKINLSIHAHCRDILERTGTVTAQEVKTAFQGIASAQTTLLVLFSEMMQYFQTRIGIDRAESTYHKYITIRKQVKRFLKVKYNVQDIPLNQLDLPFIEAFDYHLRVERKMTDESVSSTMLVLFKVVRIALNRKLIVHPPFFGFKLKKPDFKIRSITKDEFKRLISTPLESKSLCFFICKCEAKSNDPFLEISCGNRLKAIYYGPYIEADIKDHLRTWAYSHKIEEYDVSLDNKSDKFDLLVHPLK